MGPMRDPTRSPPAPAAPLEPSKSSKPKVQPAEPAPATDRTDAPLVAQPGAAGAGGSTEMPEMAVDCSIKGLAAAFTSLSFKLVELCGLPSPPGGWLGPFGFFRLVTYAFMACSIAAVFLGIMAATGQPFNGVPIIGGQPDGFATFAALLLCFGSIVSAGAAYAHEGLEQEVSAMQKQNEIFRSKNEMLAAQLDELSGVRKKLETLKEKMGENLQQFEDTLQELHTVSCAELLQMMLEAFMNADLQGVKDCRLTGDEVDALFEVCESSLKDSAPDFDLDALINAVTETGIGICNLRFLANAAVAGCDKVPGRSTAMLTLVMFSAHPEKYEHEMAIALRSVLDIEDDEIADLLKEKTMALADPKDHGRIRGHDLMDVSRKVMSANMDGETKVCKDKPKEPKEPKDKPKVPEEP